MTKELAEARADARAAQDRANRAEAALREIVAWLPNARPFKNIRPGVIEIIKRHGVNLWGDQ